MELIINKYHFQMYRIDCKVNQGTTQLTLIHQHSRVTVSALRICPTNINEARQNLLLDFNVKSDGDFNSEAMALYLKDLFGDIIARDRYIGSMLKTTVFIVQSGKNIQSTIVNACWLCFLRHGVPMLKSIFHTTWAPEMTEKKQSMKAVLDLNKTEQIIQGSWQGQIPQKARQQAKKYKQEVLNFVRQYFYA